MPQQQHRMLLQEPCARPAQSFDSSHLTAQQWFACSATIKCFSTPVSQPWKCEPCLVRDPCPLS